MQEARIKVLRDDQVAVREADNRSKAARDEQFSKECQARRMQAGSLLQELFHVNMQKIIMGDDQFRLVCTALHPV